MIENFVAGVFHSIALSEISFDAYKQRCSVCYPCLSNRADGGFLIFYLIGYFSLSASSVRNTLTE